MRLQNACVCGLAIVLILALQAYCVGQTRIDATQQSVTGASNAPQSTTTPSPVNSSTQNTPVGNASVPVNPPATAPTGSDTSNPPSQSTAPANNGTSPAAAFPQLQPSVPRSAVPPHATQPAARSGDRDPLLDLPPLPKGKVSLEGGTLVQVDPVRDRIIMTPFQGKRQEIAFDVRTQFTRDGQTIAVRDLQPGTPIYADTIWDGRHIFAKSIRIFTSTHSDQEHGQILAFDSSNGVLQVRDELFPQAVDLKVSNNTVIRKNQSPGSTADLRPGSLVAIKFQPGSHGQAYQIDVLAVPGSAFVFSGPITHIDLLAHVIGISNRSDSVIYDIHFDPNRVKITPDLQEGADVDINATFEGSHYTANDITIRSARSSQ